MIIQPHVSCNRRFSELGLISPYDITHLGVTMDVGALVDNASNAASFRRALMTPLKAKNIKGQDVTAFRTHEGDHQMDQASTDANATDNSTSGTREVGQREHNKDDESLDCKVPKVEEVLVIVTSPVSSPQNPFRTNPHGIKRRLSITERTSSRQVHKIHKTGVEKSPTVEITATKGSPLGGDYRLDKDVDEGGALIGSWLKGFAHVKCIGALGLLRMALLVFQADNLILGCEASDGKFYIFSEAGNVHEATNKINRWRVGEKATEFDADHGIIVNF